MNVGFLQGHLGAEINPHSILVGMELLVEQQFKPVIFSFWDNVEAMRMALGGTTVQGSYPVTVFDPSIACKAPIIEVTSEIASYASTKHVRVDCSAMGK